MLQAERQPSLAELLLRPFIDLERCELGPLCARGFEYYWIAFADASSEKFVLQRTLPGSFRAILVRDLGLARYLVEDPRELSPEVRSARWASMCEALEHWEELAIDQQCRLALLLHGLCFYTLLTNLIGDTPGAEIAGDAGRAELAYRRASARYLMMLPDRPADYGHADLSGLAAIAALPPNRNPVAFNAALMILVHKAKAGAPLEELFDWQARSERNLEGALVGQDCFTSALLQSRFYRAAAFVPQRRGDRADVVRTMDLAEQHARAMVAASDARSLIRLENLYPVLESRTKEALWLGDLELALARAESLIDLDPYDSRAWLELGEVRLRRQEFAPAAEAYATAATLGHPSRAVGLHMAGRCFDRLGQPLLAGFFFKASVEADAQAISPHDEIQRLPDVPVLRPLKDWSLRSFEP